MWRCINIQCYPRAEHLCGKGWQCNSMQCEAGGGVNMP